MKNASIRIAIIGTGNVGGTLGKRWAQLGHQVVFGSRDPASDKVQALLGAAGPNARATTVDAAANDSDVVLLATPWSVAKETVSRLGDLAGKTLIDATNPIAPGFELAVGLTTSGAEEIAVVAGSANVVKAFNTTGWENMADPIYGGEAITMFICGDEASAKAQVAGLAEDLGFEVVDTGGLRSARFLEPMAMVWINQAIVLGEGRDIALKLVRR